jgi:hypothetical protein
VVKGAPEQHGERSLTRRCKPCFRYQFRSERCLVSGRDLSEVEAKQITAENAVNLAAEHSLCVNLGGGVPIGLTKYTLSGLQTVAVGGWVVGTGSRVELMHDHDFRAKYEPVIAYEDSYDGRKEYSWEG